MTEEIWWTEKRTPIRETPYYQPTQLENNLAHMHASLVSLVQGLKHRNPRVRQQSLLALEKEVRHLGFLINKIIRGSKIQNNLIALADYLDQNGFYALANKVDEVSKIYKLSKTAESQVAQAYRVLNQAHGMMRRDLVTHADNLEDLKRSIQETLYGSFARGLAALGDAIGMPADDITSVAELINLSDELDKNGFYALANKSDEVALLLKTAEDYGFVPKMLLTEHEVEAQTKPFQPRSEGALSTRYCPDHRGVPAIRIGENIYQCPIDGKVYDYQSGYINYEGERVSGGSVAAQTPQTSNYGGIPMRVYDSRSSVLSRLT